jgi:hypothetical protein
MEQQPPSNKTPVRPSAWRWLLPIAVAAVLAFLSVKALDRFPVAVMVFRADGDAFKVALRLNGREPLVEPAALTPAQRRGAVRAVLSGDGTALGALSRMLGGNGRYAAAVSDRTLGEWPWYFGGGWRYLGNSRGNGGWLDSFSFPERASLALLCQMPPTAPYVGRETDPNLPIASATPVALESGFPVPAAAATPEAVLRVEILNGCGMTNAADAVARAARDAGMQVVFVGNASRWDHSTTTVETSVGLPVVLDELVGRMGLPGDAVRETAHPKPGVDVIFTVGRDYRRIRERLRD